MIYDNERILKLYKRLIELCRRRNTTLTKVLKECSINTCYLGIWKNGKKPNGEQIEKLCKKLNTSADYILFGENDISSKEDKISIDTIKKYLSLTDRHKNTIDNIVNDLYTEEQEQDEEIYKIKETV